MKGGSPVSDDEIEPVESVSEASSSDSSSESQSSSDASSTQEAASSRESDSGPEPESLSGYKDDDGLSLSKEYSSADDAGASSSKESEEGGSFRSKWRDIAGLDDKKESSRANDSGEVSSGNSADDSATGSTGDVDGSEKTGEAEEPDQAEKDSETTDASSETKETDDSAEAAKSEDAKDADKARESGESKDTKDAKGVDAKDTKDTKDAREAKDPQAAKDTKETKEARDARETKEAKEKEDKYKDQVISLLTEQVQLLTKMVQMMGGEVPGSSAKAGGSIKDGQWGDLFGSWNQGKEGNCSSVATIKAAMDKFGDNIFDKTEGSPENGYKITMKDGVNVTLSPQELQTAKRMDNFEGSGEARDYADLTYAAMAKRALDEGHEGSTTYARACHSLNNGEDPLDSAHFLGLDNNIVPLTERGLRNADSAVGWSDTHAVYVDQGYTDHYGTATEYNSSDTNKHWLYGGFTFKS
jgi:hypothetical protein